MSHPQWYRQSVYLNHAFAAGLREDNPKMNYWLKRAKHKEDGVFRSASYINGFFRFVNGEIQIATYGIVATVNASLDPPEEQIDCGCLPPRLQAAVEAVL